MKTATSFIRLFRGVLLLALCLPFPGWTEPLPTDLQRFATEIAAYERADAAQPPDQGQILFLGSSTIRMWQTLAQDFPKHRVLNRGFGGARISEVTLNLNRIAVPYAPRQIVFFAGGNDLADGHAPEQAVADFQAFVELARMQMPDIPITYIGIYHNPFRWHLRETFHAANDLLTAYCRRTPGVEFIETSPTFLGVDGRPRKELFADDQLHLNTAGYKLLAELVRPHLSKEPQSPGS
jgi:lysophospholipase L1-like esterase